MCKRAFCKRVSDGTVLLRNGALLLVVVATLQTSASALAGPWRANERNTPGWALMTPEERIEHQAKVRGFARYDACRSYQIEHHRLMAERAEQRGLPPPGGGHDFCARLRPPGSGPE
jgi:hypothetical protein